MMLVSFNSNTTDFTSGAGTTNLPETASFIPVLS